VGLLQVDDKVHEKRMEEYINEQMGVVGSADTPIETGLSKSKKEEDDLYVIHDATKADNEANEGITGCEKMCCCPLSPNLVVLKQERSSFIHEHWFGGSFSSS
jgi:hypothetical protein